MERRGARELSCEAVLFDLDGVLVDSRRAVERAWGAWAVRNGLSAEAVVGVAHGRRTGETIGLVAPDLDADEEAVLLERAEIEDNEGVSFVPGAADLLSRLPQDAWAVVTSGSRALATSRLDHLGLPRPGVFVTADDVTRGKPDPEPYLSAARALGVEAARCVVVEDAPAGVRAGKAAGMAVVGVATTHRAGELSGADVVVDTLAQISVSSDEEGLLVTLEKG